LNLKNKVNISKIIGHRGVKKLSPENTVDSIQKAIDIGLDWVEFDVKISKDNIPFLLHDDELDRTTNGSGVANLYNYSEIRNLDAGKFFYNENTNIYPPTLKEVLNLCKRNNCGVNIELKPNKGFEKKNVQEILNITNKFKNYLPIFYSSFDLESCILIKEMFPTGLCGILIDNFNILALEEILKYISKYDFFSCGLNINIINKDIVKRLKNENLFVTVYSEKNICNNKALSLWNLGVDSIFSDDPRSILQKNQ